MLPYHFPIRSYEGITTRLVGTTRLHSALLDHNANLNTDLLPTPT